MAEDSPSISSEYGKGAVDDGEAALPRSSPSSVSGVGRGTPVVKHGRRQQQRTPESAVEPVSSASPLQKGEGAKHGQAVNPIDAPELLSPSTLSPAESHTVSALGAAVSPGDNNDPPGTTGAGAAGTRAVAVAVEGGGVPMPSHEVGPETTSVLTPPSSLPPLPTLQSAMKKPPPLTPAAGFPSPALSSPIQQEPSRGPRQQQDYSGGGHDTNPDIGGNERSSSPPTGLESAAEEAPSDSVPKSLPGRLLLDLCCLLLGCFGWVARFVVLALEAKIVWTPLGEEM